MKPVEMSCLLAVGKLGGSGLRGKKQKPVTELRIRNWASKRVNSKLDPQIVRFALGALLRQFYVGKADVPGKPIDSKKGAKYVLLPRGELRIRGVE